MGVPRRYRGVHRLAVAVAILDVVASAGAAQRVLNYLAERLPLAQDLVQPIACEVLYELVHRRTLDTVGIESPRSRPHLEVDECTVAIKGDVLRPETCHALVP